MVQVRLLAPWNNAKGEPQAAGAVIDVSDEEAQDLGNRGMISRLDEEKKLEEQTHTSGVYDARATRAGTQPASAQPQPQNQPQSGPQSQRENPGAAAPQQDQRKK
jgi:hypothetical protein